MSGHSKWSTIKRKKGALDAKRGKIFSRMAKEITVAAKMGGGDPNGNPRLRTALLAARAENMPKDNLERAIKKGTGELEGVTYEEQRYEIYGPEGVALIADILTDNKNRTLGELRHTLSRFGGSLAATGAVTWNFDQVGMIVAGKEGYTEEAMFELAAEAGAENVDGEGDVYEITTSSGDLHAVADALQKAGVQVKAAKITMVPKNQVAVDAKALTALMKLMDALEDNDDVQDVFTNAEISDEAMEAAMAE